MNQTPLGFSLRPRPREKHEDSGMAVRKMDRQPVPMTVHFVTVRPPLLYSQVLTSGYHSGGEPERQKNQCETPRENQKPDIAAYVGDNHPKPDLTASNLLVLARGHFLPL